MGSRSEDWVVGAVIVTYMPDSGLIDRIARIEHQVEYVVIVDNASGAEAHAMFAEFSQRHCIHIILNDENLGIATALNQGVDELKRLGCELAMLFDQDTVPGSSVVESVVSAYAQMNPMEDIAVVGVNYRDHRGVLAHRCPEGTLWIEKKTVITSGSMIPIPVFDHIGRFRDDLFIDHVDHDYCLRGWANGFRTILLCAPMMTHVIGETKSVRAPGGRFQLSSHPPRRHYFKARNHVKMVRAHLAREPWWIFKLTLMKARDLLLMSVFGENRLAKLKVSLAGYWHGLLGKSAPPV